MQYIIMLTIVVGLAISDFVTGIIKAYIKNDLHSRTMRQGGMHKIGEIIVMLTACGLEIGITKLGEYYNAEQLASITGTFTAIAVFGYITIIEIISILENYAEIDESAAWAVKFLKRLKNVKIEEEEKQ